MGDTVTASPILGGVVTPLIDAATVVWAFNGSFAYSLTPVSNRTMANPTSLIPGTFLTLQVMQGSGGSHTLAWGTNYRFSGGTSPTLSTAEGASDVLQFYTDGTLMFLMSAALNTGAYLIPPGPLTASNNQVTQISLDWVNNATNATGVRIQRLLEPFDWIDIADVPPDTIYYLDTPLDPGSYSYRVLAFDTVHASAPSNTAVGEALEL